MTDNPILLRRRFFRAGMDAYRQSRAPLEDDACLEAALAYFGNLTIVTKQDLRALIDFARGWDWSAEQARLDEYAKERADHD